MKSIVLVGSFVVVVSMAQGCVHDDAIRPLASAFSDVRLHSTACEGELEATADVVVGIMESSGASMVSRRDTESGSIILSFRRESERLATSTSRTRGVAFSPDHSRSIAVHNAVTTTSTAYKSYGSLFYVELIPKMSNIEVLAIGEPYIDDRTYCPLSVRNYRNCRAPHPRMADSFQREIKKLTGLYLGQQESAFIDSMFAQLRRKSWKEKMKASDKFDQLRNSPLDGGVAPDGEPE